MEEPLVKAFEEKLKKLTSVTEPTDAGLNLPQESFLDCLLTYVEDGTVKGADRFNKLLHVLHVEPPVLLACRNTGFWQNVEHQDNNHEQSIKVARKKKPSDPFTDSSVCGSPLKLDIIADIYADDDLPVTVTKRKPVIDFAVEHKAAKKLVSLYSVWVTSTGHGLSLDRKKLPTLIALCTGQNPRLVSVLGLKPLIDPQNNVTGVKIIESVSKPIAYKSSLQKLKPDLTSADVTCTAKYNILADTGVKFNPDLESSFQLEMGWKKGTNQSLTLLQEPLMTGVSVAMIQRASGSSDSPLYPMHQELEILQSLLDGLRTTEVQWKGSENFPVMQALKDLVEKLKLGSDTLGGSHGETSIRASCDDTQNIAVDFMGEREDLDFTDKLWKVLKSCTYYTDLIEALNYIVAELRSGDLCPFIHADNFTTIGQMVRDSYRGQLRTLVMSGVNPLEYLVEIGIQKLQRDYVHMFLSSGLADRTLLSFFTKGNLEFHEKQELLMKLHNTLETIVMLQQSLNLPKDVLAKSCRQVLKHYETYDIDNSHQFKFVIPTPLLTGVVEKFTPTEWRMDGVKVIKGVPERLVYYMTSEQLFDWVKSDEVKMTKQKSSGDIEEESYFLTIVRESVSILC